MTCKTCGPDGCSDRVACPREYETEAQYKLIERQGEILRAVVTAVRGAHPDGGSWSTHDAAELVMAVVAERDALRAAGQSVVNRWDSPVWKDQPHTGESINRLRGAIEAPAQQAAEAEWIPVGERLPDLFEAADWIYPLTELKHERWMLCNAAMVAASVPGRATHWRPARQLPHAEVPPLFDYEKWHAECARVVARLEDVAKPTPSQPASAPRQPLTDEQIQACWVSGAVGPFEFARAIERACAEQWGVQVEGGAA